MTYIQVFLNSLFLTLFITPFLITYLIKKGIVDHLGDERKIHTRVIPRMGGLIIYLIVLIVLVSFFFSINSIKILIVGSFAIAVCGIFDDVKGLNWNIKLLFQLLATTLLLISFSSYIDKITFINYEIPLFVGYFVLFVFVLGTINSINLMDGLDGLVSGYSLIKLFFLLVFAIKFNDYFLIVVFISILGSILGFIKYNSYPARVFLGDTGSLTLGYFLTFGTLMASKDISNSASIDLIVPIIFFSTPNLDTLKVIFVRLWNNRSPFLADKNHQHHLLLSLNIKHKYVVFILQLFSILYYLTIIVYIQNNKLLALVIYILLLVLQFFLVDILSILRTSKFFNNIITQMLAVSRLFTKLYKQIFMPLTFIAIIFTIYYNYFVITKISKTEAMAALIIYSLLFLISYYHNKKDFCIHHIYIFFNTMILSLLTLNNLQIVKSIYRNIISNPILIISIFYLFIFVASFIFFRIHFIKKDVIFLNGSDLIIFTMILLINLLNLFLEMELLKIISYGLFLSLLFYAWYKIISILIPKFEEYFYYISFVLPVLILLIILIQ